jgi:hypothetical protein
VLSISIYDNDNLRVKAMVSKVHGAYHIVNTDEYLKWTILQDLKKEVEK